MSALPNTFVVLALLLSLDVNFTYGILPNNSHYLHTRWNTSPSL